MNGEKRELLLVGSNGMLARKIFSRGQENWAITGVDLPDFDLTNEDQVSSTVKRLSPDVIVNCAAYTNVDGCESREDQARLVNGTAVGYLADAAQETGATLVHVSTDYVFPGTGNTPLVEEDNVAPQSAYGRSKLLGEQAVVASGLKKYFIIRTSWLYGPGGNNFVETIIRLAKEREQLGIVADQFGSPTYTADLADAIFNLLSPAHCHPSSVSASYGLYHFSNDGVCSWYDFAVKIVELVRLQDVLNVKQIDPIKTEDYPLPAPRPAYSVLSKQKYCQATGAHVPAWQESLGKYLKDRAKC